MTWMTQAILTIVMQEMLRKRYRKTIPYLLLPLALHKMKKDIARKGKRILESDDSKSNKSARMNSSKKEGGIVMVCEKFENCMQTIMERNTTLMNLLKIVDTSKYDVTNALAKICAMPNLKLNTPKFNFACMMIKDL